MKDLADKTKKATTLAFKPIVLDATNHRTKSGYRAFEVDVDFASKIVPGSNAHMLISGFFVRGNDSKVGEMNVDVQNVRLEGSKIKFDYALNMHDDTKYVRSGQIRALIVAQVRPFAE